MCQSWKCPKSQAEILNFEKKSMKVILEHGTVPEWGKLGVLRLMSEKKPKAERSTKKKGMGGLWKQTSSIWQF